MKVSALGNPRLVTKTMLQSQENHGRAGDSLGVTGTIWVPCREWPAWGTALSCQASYPEIYVLLRDACSCCLTSPFVCPVDSNHRTVSQGLTSEFLGINPTGSRAAWLFSSQAVFRLLCPEWTLPEFFFNMSFLK